MSSWQVRLTKEPPAALADPGRLEPVGRGCSARSPRTSSSTRRPSPSRVRPATRRPCSTASTGSPAITVRVAPARGRMQEPALPGLVGAGELADLLGAGQQRVYQFVQRDDFPDPVLRLAAGPLWLASNVRAFRRQRPKQGGRAASGAAP